MCEKKNSKGVITVLVSLLLVGILSVGTLVIEAGRFQAAKTQLAEANISAATSMIAAYDSDLYTKYGLLAIDTERFTLERASDYLSFNADQAAGYKGNRLSRMYMIDSVELTGLYNLTYPSILKRQMLSRAKYHVVSQNYALNVYTMDAFFLDFQNKCLYVADKLASAANGSANNGSVGDVSNDVVNALSALYKTYKDLKTYDASCNVTLSSGSMNLLPSKTGTVENDVPSQDIADIDAAIADATTILGGNGSVLSYNNGTAIDEIDVNVNVDFIPDIINKLTDITSASNLPNNTKVLAANVRSLALGLNAAIKALSQDDEGCILLNSYIAEYFSNRNRKTSTYSAPAKGSQTNSGENMTFASACVEYVFGGYASERDNQSKAYNYLQAIRLINNLYAVMSASKSFNFNNIYVVAAHLAWANYESIVDMELLTKYNVTVPFNKNKMILPINNASSVTDAFSLKDTANAMTKLGLHNGTMFVVNGSYAFSYKDSLVLGLWFVPNSQKLLRVADLIQLEMRYKEQYIENKTASFLMSEQNTYCRIKCIAKYSSVLPILSLDSGNTFNGIMFQSVKYVGY